MAEGVNLYRGLQREFNVTPKSVPLSVLIVHDTLFAGRLYTAWPLMRGVSPRISLEMGQTSTRTPCSLISCTTWRWRGRAKPRPMRSAPRSRVFVSLPSVFSAVKEEGDLHIGYLASARAMSTRISSCHLPPFPQRPGRGASHCCATQDSRLGIPIFAVHTSPHYLCHNNVSAVVNASASCQNVHGLRRVIALLCLNRYPNNTGVGHDLTCDSVTSQDDSGKLLENG